MTLKYIWQLESGDQVAQPVYDNRNVKIIDKGILSEKTIEKLLRFGIDTIWVHSRRKYVN